MEVDSIEVNETLTENIRSPRQLRPPPIASSTWLQFDSIADANSKSFQPSNTFPRFLHPPHNGAAGRFYKNDNGFSQAQTSNKNEYNPYVNAYTKSNSLTELPKHRAFSQSSNLFRPYDELPRHKDYDYFPNSFKSSTKAPFQIHLPVFLGAGNKKHNTRKPSSDSLPDNFSYYHIGSGQKNSERDNRKINPLEIVNKLPNVAVLPNATPKSPQFISFSTVAGFYNNQAAEKSTTPSPVLDAYKQFSKYHTFNTHQPNAGVTPAPVYENHDSSDYFSKQYFPTKSTEYTTSPRSYFPPKTTQRTPESTYYSGSLAIKHLNNEYNSPSIYSYELGNNEESTEPHRYFVTQLTEKAFPSLETTVSTKPTQHFPSTRGPIVGIDFNFDKFVERIRQGHIGNVSPTLSDALHKFESNYSKYETTTEHTTRKEQWPTSLSTGGIATKSTPRPFFHSNPYEYHVSV